MRRQISTYVYLLILLTMARRIWRKLSSSAERNLLHAPGGIRIFRGMNMSVAPDRLVAYIGDGDGNIVVVAIFDTGNDYDGVGRFQADLNEKLGKCKINTVYARNFMDITGLTVYTMDRGVNVIGAVTYARIAAQVKRMRGNPKYPYFEVPFSWTK